MSTKFIYKCSDGFETENAQDALDYISVNKGTTFSETYISDEYNVNNEESILFSKLTGVPEDKVLCTDFTVHSLIKASPEYDKGRKIKSEYYDDELQSNKVIEKTFIDRISPEGKLEGLDIDFKWFKNNGNVGKTKQIYKPLSQYEAGAMLKKRRDRIIDYFVEGAKGSPIETQVGAIFHHYREEIAEFIATGDDTLLNAVNNETDTTIISYLNIMFNATDSVKDRILLLLT